MVHIEGKKDFTPVIEKSLALGGYEKPHTMTGINGGHTLRTGFDHGTILSITDKTVNTVNFGEINHFFLVGDVMERHQDAIIIPNFLNKHPLTQLF